MRKGNELRASSSASLTFSSSALRNRSSRCEEAVGDDVSAASSEGGEIGTDTDSVRTEVGGGPAAPLSGAALATLTSVATGAAAFVSVCVLIVSVLNSPDAATLGSAGASAVEAVSAVDTSRTTELDSAAGASSSISASNKASGGLLVGRALKREGAKQDGGERGEESCW